MAIRDDFNVSSITDHGAGDYTVNFDVAMPTANYSLQACGSSVAGSGNTNGVFAHEHLSAGPTLSRTTSAVRVYFIGAAFTNQDAFSASIAVFGD